MNVRWGQASAGVGVVAMMTLGPLDLVQHSATMPETAFALSAVRTLPVVVSRWRPLEAWWFALVGAVGTALVMVPVWPSEPWPWPVSSAGLLVVLTGVLAARGNRRQTMAALVVLTLVGLGLIVAFPPPDGFASLAATTALCGVAAVLGDLWYARRRVTTELAEERQVSAAERDRRAVVEERSRIARELHDVVAHHMSMITVQAETARYRLADLPASATEEFTGIARLARGSLAELRGLLSALRDEEDAPALAPQPSLADLDALVDRIRAAGTPVDLRVDGRPGGLPNVVQLAAYRVVQEALSNVVRHASGAATMVTVVAEGGWLAVEVVNTRPAQPTAAVEGGHGLVGLRERVVLLGGTFEVDQPDGGWRVSAGFPVGEAS